MKETKTTLIYNLNKKHIYNKVPLSRSCNDALPQNHQTVF